MLKEAFTAYTLKAPYRVFKTWSAMPGAGVDSGTEVTAIYKDDYKGSEKCVHLEHV
jgi:hypothetical protein